MNEKELLKILNKLNKEKCYTEEDLLVLNIQRELIKNEIKQNNLMVESVKEQKYNKLLRENRQLKDRINKAVEYMDKMTEKELNYITYKGEEYLVCGSDFSDGAWIIEEILKGDKE